MNTIHHGFSGGYSLTVECSTVWALFLRIVLTGWDFGVPGSSPIGLSGVPLSRPHLGSIVGTRQKNLRIKDIVTGQEVLYLPGRFAQPVDSCWDGQYLVAGYDSGEVLILDFGHVPPSKDL